MQQQRSRFKMLSSRISPQPREKTPSPIKVKDYFTNPLHKIRQPAFTQVGFSVSALNTFVKNFTNRQNSKYVSLPKIKDFIRNFTNNNAKLMQMYEQFFTKNFKLKEGMIEVQHFVQFFIKQTNQEELNAENLKKVYKDMEPFTAQTLMRKSQHLEVPLSHQQANRIIKMINYKCGSGGIPIKIQKQISFQNFYTALKQAQ